MNLHLELVHSVNLLFFFQMIYNAQGEIIIPFLPHKGNMPEPIKKHFVNKIFFFQTDDGLVDKTTLVLIVYTIQK